MDESLFQELVRAAVKRLWNTAESLMPEGHECARNVTPGINGYATCSCHPDPVRVKLPERVVPICPSYLGLSLNIDSFDYMMEPHVEEKWVFESDARAIRAVMIETLTALQQ